MIPAITGTTTCHNNFIIIECISAIPALLDDDNTKPTNKGVITNPNILEILALKIAPGIFPLAIPTITTEEETVEGIAAIKNMPSHKGWLIGDKIGFNRNAINGNNTNVES